MSLLLAKFFIKEHIWFFRKGFVVCSTNYLEFEKRIAENQFYSLPYCINIWCGTFHYINYSTCYICSYVEASSYHVIIYVEPLCSNLHIGHVMTSLDYALMCNVCSKYVMFLGIQKILQFFNYNYSTQSHPDITHPIRNSELFWILYHLIVFGNLPTYLLKAIYYQESRNHICIICYAITMCIL